MGGAAALGLQDLMVAGTAAAISRMAGPLSDPGQVENHIALFRFATGRLTDITSTHGAEINPDWSPDERLIAFNTRRHRGPGQTVETRIRIVGAAHRPADWPPLDGSLHNTDSAGKARCAAGAAAGLCAHDSGPPPRARQVCLAHQGRPGPSLPTFMTRALERQAYREDRAMRYLLTGVVAALISSGLYFAALGLMALLQLP